MGAIETEQGDGFGFAPHGASELKYAQKAQPQPQSRFAPHGASELKSINTT